MQYTTNMQYCTFYSMTNAPEVISAVNL